MEAHSETHFENENMFLEKWKVINPFFLKEILKKLISILRMWTCIQILQVFMEEGVYPLGLKVTPVHSRQDTLVKQSQGEITIIKTGRLKRSQFSIQLFFSENFRKYFIFLPAFYLVMWPMIPAKNFEKIVILKIWELISHWSVKIHFGEIPLK